MYFKLAHIINPFSITFPANGKLRLKDKDSFLTLQPLTAQEREKYNDGLHCEARLRRDVPAEITAAYERRLINRMPDGFQKPPLIPPGNADRFPYVDNDGNLTPGTNPHIDLYPQYFQDFYFALQNELSDNIENIVKTIRWRLGKRSSHRATKFTRGMSWSQNGRSWRKMPFDIHGDMNFEFSPRLEGQLLHEIKALIKKEDHEPSGQELFLEAWEQRGSNPRSSLVIGIAAAEAGFKQFVSRLTPDAQWLAENAPTLPLVSMVKNYLPFLPAKLKIDNRVLSLPKSIRNVLDGGVQLRNKTSHVGHAAPRGKDLEDILLAVRDLLYLLDYYAGNQWAMECVRIETIEQMANDYNFNIPYEFRRSPGMAILRSGNP